MRLIDLERTFELKRKALDIVKNPPNYLEIHLKNRDYADLEGPELIAFIRGVVLAIEILEMDLDDLQ